MDGISVVQEDGYVVCHINELSDELKTLITEELSAICHGKNEVEEYALERHSYKSTLKQFLDLYSPKTPETKKGMMGEFITHLVLEKFLPNLRKISIFFNKEEQSIRKGFDLTYMEVDGSSVWYGEVKSGELNNTDTVDEKNKALLNSSKVSIKDFLDGHRPSIWNSALIDVGLSLAQESRKKVKNLLDGDLRQITESPGTKKKAVLISVVFHDINNKTSHEVVRDHLATIKSEDIFENVILFSIQKSTYIAIEDFLKEELERIQQE